VSSQGRARLAKSISREGSNSFGFKAQGLMGGKAQGGGECTKEPKRSRNARPSVGDKRTTKQRVGWDKKNPRSKGRRQSEKTSRDQPCPITKGETTRTSTAKTGGLSESRSKRKQRRGGERGAPEQSRLGGKKRGKEHT